ncbi:MAG: hypothetical protein ACU84Q_19505 [Gammaproteobacteria bacterium]
MKSLDDKATVMMLLREATEQSLKLEAMSLITPGCTSSEELDWGEIRQSLERLLNDAARNKSKDSINLSLVSI